MWPVSTEKKLNKLKTNSSVLEQLTERREACMENLLRGTIELPSDTDLNLDSSETSHNQLVRHIIPEQAINSAELLHIIKHDQLATETTEDVEQSKQTELEN